MLHKSSQDGAPASDVVARSGLHFTANDPEILPLSRRPFHYKSPGTFSAVPIVRICSNDMADINPEFQTELINLILIWGR